MDVRVSHSVCPDYSARVAERLNRAAADKDERPQTDSSG